MRIKESEEKQQEKTWRREENMVCLSSASLFQMGVDRQVIDHPLRRTTQGAHLIKPRDTNQDCMNIHDTFMQMREIWDLSPYPQLNPNSAPSTEKGDGANVLSLGN